MTSEQTVYLMRHGEAEPHSFGGDAARRLTKHGEQVVETVALGLKQKGPPPDHLWHSPFTRAVETASIMGHICDIQDPLIHDGVTPGADPARLIAELPHAPNNLLIVSHLPFLPELVRRLLRDENIGAIPPATVIKLSLRDGLNARLVEIWRPSDWVATT